MQPNKIKNKNEEITLGINQKEN